MLALSALCTRDPLWHIDARRWDRIATVVCPERQICPGIHPPWHSRTGSCRRVRSPCIPGWFVILLTHKLSKGCKWWLETSLRIRRIRSHLGKPNTEMQTESEPNLRYSPTHTVSFKCTYACSGVIQTYLLNKKKHVSTLSHQMPPKGSCNFQSWRIYTYTNAVGFFSPFPVNSQHSTSRLVVLMRRFIFPAASFCDLTTWSLVFLDWTLGRNQQKTWDFRLFFREVGNLGEGFVKQWRETKPRSHQNQTSKRLVNHTFSWFWW